MRTKEEIKAEDYRVLDEAECTRLGLIKENHETCGENNYYVHQDCIREAEENLLMQRMAYRRCPIASIVESQGCRLAMYGWGIDSIWCKGSIAAVGMCTKTVHIP
jgi:hypothetical protein